MKKNRVLLMFILIAALMLGGPTAEAQGQNSKERTYMLEQIAALKIYIGYLKKGYNLVQDGTKLIGDIKQGDLNLHKDYFDGLKSVNPEIIRYKKVSDISQMYQEMSRRRQRSLSIVRQSGFFSGRETDRINGLYDKIEKEAATELEKLLSVTTSGRLSMTDDERIEKIDKIYDAVQIKYIVQQRLNRNILELTAGREQKISDLRTLRALY